MVSLSNRFVLVMVGMSWHASAWSDTNVTVGHALDFSPIELDLRKRSGDLCGYNNADINNPDSCPAGYLCGYNPNVYAYDCCVNPTSCYYQTACVPYLNACGASCQTNANVLKCGSTAKNCIRVYHSVLGYAKYFTEWQCATNLIEYTVFPTATNAVKPPTTIITTTQNTINTVVKTASVTLTTSIVAANPAATNTPVANTPVVNPPSTNTPAANPPAQNNPPAASSPATLNSNTTPYQQVGGGISVSQPTSTSTAATGNQVTCNGGQSGNGNCNAGNGNNGNTGGQGTGQSGVIINNSNNRNVGASGKIDERMLVLGIFVATLSLVVLI